MEAIKNVTKNGEPVADVAQCLGVVVYNLYAWIPFDSKPKEQQDGDQSAVNVANACG
ncbi:hypothetical protein ACIQT6_11430 [Pseudomonas asiatica]|uniref:hypothetical protein n=1 Tax=Pseudomonas asiatica TaxID=2219225 RepID=UPI003839FD46